MSSDLVSNSNSADSEMYKFDIVCLHLETDLEPGPQILQRLQFL